MAEDGKTAPKPKPGGAATKAKTAVKKVAAEKKLGPAKYHVFTVEGEVLKPYKVVENKTPERVVSELVAADSGLVGKKLAVIPARNFKTFNTQVETKTRVKVSAA